MKTAEIYLDLGALGEECKVSVTLEESKGYPDHCYEAGKPLCEGEKAGFEVMRLWRVVGHCSSFLTDDYRYNPYFRQCVDEAIINQVYNGMGPGEQDSGDRIDAAMEARKAALCGIDSRAGNMGSWDE